MVCADGMLMVSVLEDANGLLYAFKLLKFVVSFRMTLRNPSISNLNWS